MPATRETATVWVLARPGDDGLGRLSRLGSDVRCVIGDRLETFADAPMPDALLVCAAFRELLSRLVERLPDLRWVHVRSAGLDGLSLGDLSRPGLVITNGRGVYSDSLAEFSVAALLFFVKELRLLVRQQDRQLWRAYVPRMLAGRRLGVVGYGDIGRAVAERAHALGMRIHALRRDARASADDPLLERTLPADRLIELLEGVDDVVVSTPLTPETRGLIGARELAALRPASVLVNVGRGAVVQEQPLIEALRAGRLGGAALDVFETEPLPAGHPFYSLENVLLSPHSADHVPGWLDGAMDRFIENLVRFRSGSPLLSPVVPLRGY